MQPKMYGKKFVKRCLLALTFSLVCIATSIGHVFASNSPHLEIYIKPSTGAGVDDSLVIFAKRGDMYMNLNGTSVNNSTEAHFFSAQ